MATDTLPELGKKKADIKAVLQQLGDLTARTLADCEWIKEWVHRSRATIESKLCRGALALEFALELERFKGYGEEVLDVYALLAEGFADWKPVARVLPSIQKETEEFVTWVAGLLARINRSRPPIDESKLPQVPAVAAGLAPGFTSLEDLRQQDE